MRAEVVVPCADHLGEGAFWHARRQRLYWLDVPMPSRLHSLDPVTGETRTHAMPQMIASMRAWGNGLVIAAHGGIFRFDPDTETLVRICEPEPDLPFNRCNDGGTDRRGRFWFGTMQNNISPGGEDIAIVGRPGALYSLDTGLTLRRHVSGIMISNTVCFSPDGGTLYFCDTADEVIGAYDYDEASGTLGARRDFARFGRGVPDGSCVDAEGGLWNARWDGSCVVRFGPDGSVDRVVEVPAARVTSVAFGGAALDTLYITTARWGLPPGGGDGHLFAVDPGVRGLPAPPFGAPWGD